MLKIILSALILFSLSQAEMFQSVALKDAHIVQSGKDRAYCPNCGMDLAKFYKTNHVHHEKQFCSLHCLVESTEFKEPTDVKVVDTNSLKLIDASTAFYVVGSKKNGTMSMNSKYAFSSEANAKEFMSKNGGKVMSFSDSYEVAKGDFAKDMKMINTKKEKKMYAMGKMLLEKKCDMIKIDLNNFATISSLKAHLRDSDECKDKLQDKELQAVSIYLFDVVKGGKKVTKSEPLHVPHDAKCPVCGMFVAKYPKWAAYAKIGDEEKYFDGVKDMIKYIFIKDVVFDQFKVSDYYTTNAIDAKNGYFVYGSNVYGPMGNELIPFSDMEKAKEFSQNHGGKKILRFRDITLDIVKSLDE